MFSRIIQSVARPIQTAHTFVQDTRNQGLSAATSNLAGNEWERQQNMTLQERMTTNIAVGAAKGITVGTVVGATKGTVKAGAATIKLGGVGAPVGLVAGGLAGGMIGTIGGIKGGVAKALVTHGLVSILSR